ncbi:MAG: hydantoinase B/oxoprolinase family protein [Acidobacteriota bacterium]
MPVHLGAMPLSVRAVREAFTLEPGDVALVNDPFQGGTHLPDITAVAPVFTGGRTPSFYVASRAHHADVGGMSPGSMPLAREIFQEGLRIPPILIQRRGHMDRDLLRLILANVRTPIEREGDLAAQLASLERGERRLKELSSKYGPAKLQNAARDLQDYSARMMRASLRELPSGVYRFEDVLDNDGLGSGPLPVRVRITIQRDKATVDFTGSAPQALGPSTRTTPSRSPPPCTCSAA